MNVVAHAADFDGWRILILEHSRQICVHLFSQGSQKEWFAMFRAEDEMNIKFGEGLAHVGNRVSPFQGFTSRRVPLTQAVGLGCVMPPLRGSI